MRFLGVSHSLHGRDRAWESGNKGVNATVHSVRQGSQIFPARLTIRQRDSLYTWILACFLRRTARVRCVGVAIQSSFLMTR